MKQLQTFDNTLLNTAGLNRQAVFNLDALPADVLASLDESKALSGNYRQLILIGHAGRRLWEAVTASGVDSDDPIDDFTMLTVRRWFEACQPNSAFQILYPGTQAIGLQRLGQLAGWHQPSPFMIGIDSEWGTWFAYRAVVLADTNFDPTKAVVGEHPCGACEDRRCIASCPGEALTGGTYDLGKCITYRKQEGSACKATCVARVSCPVGSTHRYCDEQIRHTYSISMRAIERYC